MDVGRSERFFRLMFTTLLTITCLVVCLVLLIYVQQSSVPVSGSTTPESFWVLGTSNPGECMRVCDLKVYSQSCQRVASGAPELLITDFWDSTGTLSSAGHPAPASCPTSSSSGSWASAGCFNANTDPQWLGLRLPSAESLQCIGFTQRAVSAASSGVKKSNPLSEVQLYSCPESKAPTTNNSVTWDFRAACTATTALKPSTSVNGNSNGFLTFPTGSLSVTADATCAQTITMESAQAVLDEQITKTMQDPSWDPTKDYDHAKWLGSNANPTVNCYCLQQEALVGAATFRKPPYNKETQKLCEQWIIGKFQAIAFTIGSVAAVTILNEALLFIFYYLCDFEKHRTRTGLTYSQFIKLFIATFMNTGLLVFVINSNWYNQFDDFVLIPFLHLGNGAFGDIGSNWYLGVGSSLCLTVLIEVFSSTCTQLVMSFLVKPLFIWFFRRGLVLQQSLNIVYVLPEWSLSCRMAQTMTLVAVGMMYSGGMPIMNFFMMGYCFVAYWTDKWVILQGSRRPPQFSAKLMKVATDIFPFVAFLHCLIALWSFGNQNVFPSEFGWLQSFFGGFIGVDLEQYEQWTEAFYVASERERQDRNNGIWQNYQKARILDMSRGSCR